MSGDGSEFAFELALCAHLERSEEAVVARQLGAGVRGRRVVDVVLVEPGPAFDARAAITPESIPAAAIEGDAGPGRARYWKDAVDCHPERARRVVERAVAMGFFERERRGGREYVRQAARYPEGWYATITGVENKPDLDAPGALETQLRTDVSLGLLDRAVLATGSYVTRAHLNRIPDEVGVWRFSGGEREVVREPTPLAPDEPGVEPLDRGGGRTEIAVVPPEEKARVRRRLAERAYGKGWRTYDLPACANVDPAAGRERTGVGGLPFCRWTGGLVDPATACGPSCPGCEPAEPPAVDPEAERDARTPWVAAPEGVARRQSRLDREWEG